MPFYDELFYFFVLFMNLRDLVLRVKLWTASTLSIPVSLFDSPST